MNIANEKIDKSVYFFGKKLVSPISTWLYKIQLQLFNRLHGKFLAHPNVVQDSLSVDLEG